MQILIVDLGSQYTLLIGRALRELGVRSIILPPGKAEQWIGENRGEMKGIIISGGAASISELEPEELPPSILAVNRPILGICLGMHWIAQAFGGKVGPIGEMRGYGSEESEILVTGDPLLRRVTRERNTVWMSHGDSVTKLPRGFRRVMATDHCPVAAMGSDDGMIFGAQFHPEVEQTECGREIFSGFLALCGAERDWEPADIIKQIRQEVAAAVGPDENAILAFSGGVDSSTLAAIVAPVLGRRLVCVTLDHGGLRAGEREEIAENAQAAGCLVIVAQPNRPSFHVFSRSPAFLKAVASAGTDAEAKRRAFRLQYQADLEMLAVEADAGVLIQGTLAPDVIESGKIGRASTIKTHHNVGLTTHLCQVNPLSGFFKYEVRELARHLGLPSSISERKPFPGPGLYCRIVGATVTSELLEIVRWADAEARRIIAEAGIENEFAQLVVALIGIQTVGVKGDGRSYGYAAVIRAVQTSDFMTCRGYQFPPETRRRIQSALTKHNEIVRVWFDENDKPPATIELE